MENPAFSIILPTYNRKEYFKNALDSILNQENENWELIIINDGKIDLKDIIPEDIRIKYIKNEKTIGAPASRNIGIKLAKSEIIAYLDDDDEWLPDHLSISSDILFNYDFIYSGAKIKCNNLVIKDLNKDFSHKELAKRNFITPSTVFHKKKMIYEVGMWNEKLSCLQDWDLWCRILLKTTKIYHRNKTTVIINFHNNSITTKTAGSRIRKKIIRNIKLKYYIPIMFRHFALKIKKVNNL